MRYETIFSDPHMQVVCCVPDIMAHDDGDIRNDVIAEQRNVLAYQETVIDSLIAELERAKSNGYLPETLPVFAGNGRRIA